MMRVVIMESSSLVTIPESAPALGVVPLWPASRALGASLSNERACTGECKTTREVAYAF
jgi:hypothetical protein